MSNNEILEVIENSEFEVFGIRCDDYEYKIGEILYNSRNTFQDPLYDENDELVYPLIKSGFYKGNYDAGMLNGTCAVELFTHRENFIEKCLNDIAPYNYCKYIYLIAGNECEEGNDPDEIIIENARILAIIK